MKRSLLIILILLFVSPLFGIYLANIVGYHEPLDIAGELLDLKDISDEINWTPFKDYTVPGLPDWLGYITSGALGILIIMLIGSLVKTFMKRDRVR
jgi:cobalt/nickel transport protein